MSNHKSTELARLFYREMLKVHENGEWSPTAKTEALGRLLELLFLETTKEDNIHFTTLFARIAFACHKFQVEKKTQYWVHFFRKKLRSLVPENEAVKLYGLGLRATAACIEALFGEPVPAEVAGILPKKMPYAYKEVEVKEFRKKARVVALADDEANDLLLARDEENPSQIIGIQYNIADRNETFSPTIREIRQTFGFPITLSLIDVEIVDAPPKTKNLNLKTIYRPRAIVVEPDYLLDVSAIANCFQGNSAEPVVYLLQKFLPSEPSMAMILGNVANFFLDELMHNPKAVFKETFPKVFKISPLLFSLLPDAAIRELYEKSQRHWVTLQTMVLQGMKKFDIEPAQTYLEPSFYDETHGLQGRLDVFFKSENRSAIIELKSGKPFMANRYGIGASHFIQTLLYDLMVSATFGDGVEPASYILYSGLETNQLRFAPPVKSEQHEALQLRNQLVALDRQLAAINAKVEQVPILGKISTARFPHIKGYLAKDIELFEKTYHSLNSLEKRYFNAFSGLIAREHQLAKTGIQGVDRVNGLASLWLDTFEEKEAGYQIIKSLKIKANRANEDDAIIVFEKTQTTNPLANFRTGDIAVLYPSEQPSVLNPQSSVSSAARTPNLLRDGSSQSPVSTQIFKITVLSVSAEEVVVRLRYKQYNLQIFNEFEMWNLEHDQMDMGFTAMYQGLFRWAKSDLKKRELLLTTKPPGQAQNAKGIFENDSTLTDEQNRILQKMLSAQDYFLLWGPPGTGKTSQMLKQYAGWVFKNTDENLLLLAYTNRAVDEICEALDSLGDTVKGSYLRIGSRYSTGEAFQNQLLSKKIEGITKRSELKEVLGHRRIFVATLASLSNNLELLKLKKFRRVVVDEASQILEPMLVGLLPQFEQFILVGDHKQLPAVVVQTPEASAVGDEQLQAIGLNNLRNSLFERLYRRCCEQGWHWAFDHLSHQGRMHQDIMRFPGEHFYEGKLRILPDGIAISKKQAAVLMLQSIDFQHDWQKNVLERRLAFIPTSIDWHSPSRKTNRHEAELLAALVKLFQKTYSPSSHQSPVTNHQSIGIITPYRAQIAQIQEVFQKENINSEGLTIDTVERYQGGARDIILISLCTNAASQMDSLVSLSEEGVDRKLNVALTRAREHVVVLGNEELLRQNEVYGKLIDFCKSYTPLDAFCQRLPMA